MSLFTRTDKSIAGRWWWTVDRWMLALVLVLLGTGLWLALTASPAVAERIGLDPMHFAKRQFVYLLMSAVTVIGISLMPVQLVRRLCIIGFPLLVVLLILTLAVGPVYKGASRWLQIGSFTLQPSEFLKPVFIVVTAWLLSANFKGDTIPAKAISFALMLLVVGLLLLQPDIGQTLLIVTVWLGQMALAGLPMLWLCGAGLTGVAGLLLAYQFFPHVASRINRFIDPASGDTYQTDKAIEAMEAGGLFGKGPGEGTVKLSLPDAHTDYIFAVIGEEFGAFAGLMLLALFAGIVLRGLMHLLEEEDPFKLLAAAGLIMQFGTQALINIGVNLAILPSKGMTLPFISYGGSSMLALALGMGMVLALTRRNRYLKSDRPAFVFRGGL